MSGFVVALLAQAKQLPVRIGWSERDALEALLAVTDSNLATLRAQGLPHALAGAFRHGDVGTVEGHLEAIEAVPGAMSIATPYRGVGQTATDLSFGAGLDEAAAARLREVLDRPVDRSAGSMR